MPAREQPRARARQQASDLHGEIFRAQLPREPGCGSNARRLVETHLAQHPAPILRDAKTVVSELVNNAFIHGQGTIQLRLAHHRNRLRIEVIDEGNRADVHITEPGLHGGRGLRIVDRLARRWGSHEGTTHVWADIDLPPANPAAPLPPQTPPAL